MKKLRIKKKAKVTILILVVLGLFLIATSIIYCYMASPIDRNSDTVIEVEIKSGMSTKEIASLLKKRGLIRNSDFFILYSKLNNCSSLKASTYDLKKNMSLNSIFNIICAGDYSKEGIRLTFKEGKRITDYAEIISKNTNNKYDDVIKLMKDREYMKILIKNYWFLTDDILNEDIYYPLEGYLYPDTYEFVNKDVSVEEIVTVLLDNMDKKLVEYKDSLENGTHSIHEYITLASILELEGTNDENRKVIAGIFENRLNRGMSLGSDVTTYYAVQKPMTSDLTVEEFNSVNPYNTRNINKKGLPVGPICSVTINTIEDSLNPTKSNYFYFVADKDKNIYYTKTDSEHTMKVNELKKEGKWLW